MPFLWLFKSPLTSGLAGLAGGLVIAGLVFAAMKVELMITRHELAGQVKANTVLSQQVSSFKKANDDFAKHVKEQNAALDKAQKAEKQASKLAQQRAEEVRKAYHKVTIPKTTGDAKRLNKWIRDLLKDYPELQELPQH